MSTDLSDDDLQNLIKDIRIPPRPQILLEIEELIDNDASNDQIADLVIQDMALSAKVLSIVNSPLFGLAQKVTSLRDAVMIFGIKGLTNLIRVTMLREMIGTPHALGTLFWDTCIATAQSGAHVALQVVCNLTVDDGYSLGLFHKCGMPLMEEKYDDYVDAVNQAKNEGRFLFEVEQERYGCNHAMIGSLVARKWGLAPQIGAAIRNQYIVGGTDLKPIEQDAVCALQMSTWLSESYMEEIPFSDEVFLFYRDCGNSDEFLEGFITHFERTEDEMDTMRQEVNEKLEDFFRSENG